MASTNKTTNYELSQYIGTDKPTYLTDYNQDMTKIDAGIHAAKAEADSNATNIGDLTSLTTTVKTSAVAAINELDSDLGTLNTTVGNHTTAIADNTSDIGTLSGLTTTAKNNLVAAINEVDSNSDSNASNIGTLSSLTTTAKNNLVAAVNEVKGQINDFNLTSFVTPTLTITKTADGSSAGVTVNNNTIKIAKNSNGSIFKFYGSVMFGDQAYKGELKYTFSNTGLPAIDTAYTIGNAAITFLEDGSTMNQRVRDITYETNGNITMTYTIGAATREFVYIPNCLYFNSNFGDVPTPE